VTEAELASYPVDDPATRVDWSDGGTVLAFLNEVAGGRKLLQAIRERVDAGADTVAIAAPQNQPIAGQIVDRDEIRDAARSRVEVTQSVLDEFGIEAVASVLDPDPFLAFDDAMRAFEPREALLSALYESRYGLRRRDLVEWAKDNFEAPVIHIPVRIDDDAVRWDVTHTLVVGTQTIASPELVEHLRSRASERPHRYTLICPRSGDMAREDVVERLARTLAELYRADIDATGQPMSPEPFAAISNANEHYRIDEILISTLSGAQSKWLEEGLVDRVKEITDKPIEHFEASNSVIPAGGSAAAQQPAEVSA
jgi:hypothetical protein